MNHQDKDCHFIPPDEKKYYGSWLYANGQNPILLIEITAELDHLNSLVPDLPLNQSPRTPTSMSLLTTSYTIPDPQKMKTKERYISPIPFEKLNKESPNTERNTKKESTSPSTSLCMEKLAWDVLIPKLNQPKLTQEEPNVKNMACMQDKNPTTNAFANINDFSQYFPDLSFIPHLSYSPTLSLGRLNITTPNTH